MRLRETLSDCEWNVGGPDRGMACLAIPFYPARPDTIPRPRGLGQVRRLVPTARLAVERRHPKCSAQNRPW